MDERHTNTICSPRDKCRGEEFSNERGLIVERLKELCVKAEEEQSCMSSDELVQHFHMFLPIDIRSLLCLPNFILVDKGWRVSVVGRMLQSDLSPTGLIRVVRDLLHQPVVSKGRKGDYVVKNVAMTNLRTYGDNFFIWTRQIRTKIDV